MTEIMKKVCETPECNLPAKLQCPTCVKLGIQSSFFCSQDCFKGSWKTHRLIHKVVENKDANVDADDSYNPWPHFQFTGKLRPYRQTMKRAVPDRILKPEYADSLQGIPYSEQQAKLSSQIRVLPDEEIEGMRLACKLGREVLEEVSQMIDVNVTTEEIDRVVHEACIDRDCYPSPLNYYEFPKSCCTSVNEVICHGIPDHRPLANGDICNVDVTVYHRGYHGDLNETFFIGEVGDVGKKLVQTTWDCLQKAIEAVRPGEKYREIGNVIQKYAQSKGFSVVRTYCGHGIHKLFHTAPSVPHYAKNKVVGIMKAGHCFTIEPMINQGNWRDITWPDKWTAVTVDGLLSAQFEETLLVTDTGVEVLTKRLKKDGQPYFMDKL